MAPSDIPTLILGRRQEDISYRPITAVRCFVVKAGQICLIHVKEDNFYKLPGGGLDPDDEGSHEIACRRESLEETGCDIELKSITIAHSLEYRGTLKQDSYAYVCAVWEDTGGTDLTADEKQAGYTHHWFGLEEAREKMEEIRPNTELGESTQKRDTFLLDEYLRMR